MEQADIFVAFGTQLYALKAHFSEAAAIGGFNQRQGDALPPQIFFFTLKFVVWAKLQNDDVLLQ